MNLSTVGTSQVIAPDGSVIDGLPVDEAGYMLTEVPLRTGLTPAVVLGDAVPIGIATGSLLSLAIMGLALRTRRRTV